MASIRLFGRGKSAAAAGGPAVSAALIADALEGLAAASMSTTWRCRHAAGASIGEGAVDFSARRSRSTVIRGKYAFEYVRSGASVYRARVQDVDDADGDGSSGGAVAAGAGGSDSAALSVSVDELESAFEDDDEAEVGVEGDDDDEAEYDDALDADDEYGDESEDEAEVEGAESDDIEAEAEDADEEDADGGAGEEETGDEAEPAAEDGGAAAAGGMVWESFSEHDACGVHAYAEPAVLAAGVRAAGVVQAREAQEFDGVLLSAFAVTVKPKPGDPNRVLARLARQLRDHGANVVVVTAFADESGADGGLDGDGPDAESESGSEGGAGARIVRLRIELPHWTPADDPTADHSVSVDLFEFGEPVSIDVPGDAARRRARSCADLGLF